MRRFLLLGGVSLMGAGAGVAAEQKPEPLSVRQQKIIPIAAFTASGDLESLDPALRNGLDAGLTIAEINEVLVQMYAYAGFPRSLNGIHCFMAVVNERKADGIEDAPGVAATPLPDGVSSLELGTKNQTELIGAPATGDYIEFSPEIDRYLKAHLFGDIFGRDVLSFQDREVATLAALAAMKGVGPQLQAHFRLAQNTGLTKADFEQVIQVLGADVNQESAERASAAWEQVSGR